MVFMYINVHVKKYAIRVNRIRHVYILFTLCIDYWYFCFLWTQSPLVSSSYFFCVFLFVFNIIKETESKIELSRMHVHNYVKCRPLIELLSVILHCIVIFVYLIHWFTYSLYTCNTSLPMYMFNLIVSNLWNVRIQISTQFHKFLFCFIMKVFYLYISVYIFLDATWSRIPSQPRNFFFYQ